MIGPLVVCGAVFSAERLETLSEVGVRDSKKLSSERREYLADSIKRATEAYEIVEVKAETIDRLRKDGVNLNRIEAVGFASVLNKLDFDEVYIDSMGVSPENFADTLRGFLDTNVDPTVECRADENYPQVSAASVLAKVRRDERIRELEKEHGEMGSGYPSDGKTVRFLEDWMGDHAELPSFVRKSWKTVGRLKRI